MKPNDRPFWQAKSERDVAFAGARVADRDDIFASLDVVRTCQHTGLRVLLASDIIGIRGMLVDAISDDAREFLSGLWNGGLATRSDDADVHARRFARELALKR